MTCDADIVVAGAGHNSLLTACYLAKAGYRCLVLDARPIPGGGAATEELLLPGFGIDTCATGHTMIRVNPALSRDELGLVAGYGLRYAEPDPVAQVAFPDGQQFTMWLDPDRTAAEVARFSAADAAAYLRLLDEYDQVKDIFTRSQFTPVGFGPALDAMLAEHPAGRIWARRRQLSAVQVVQHEFTSRHIQAFLLWMAFQVFQPGDEPGSGVLPYAQTFGRQRRSWSIPLGGSGQLTAALTGYLADHGGAVRCGQRVTRLLLDGGRCAGVATEDGTEYRAGTAVAPLSTSSTCGTWRPPAPGPPNSTTGWTPTTWACPASPATTARPPRRSSWPAAARAARCPPAGRLARGRAPARRRPAGRAVHRRAAVAAGGHADAGRPRPRAGGSADGEDPDPAELPAAAGPGGWGRAKHGHARRQLDRLRRAAPNFTDEVILASLVKSPADIEELNPHIIHGAFHGGNRGPAFSGPLRPVPGPATHRMPIPGLDRGRREHPSGRVDHRGSRLERRHRAAARSRA